MATLSDRFLGVLKRRALQWWHRSGIPRISDEVMFCDIPEIVLAPCRRDELSLRLPKKMD